jgi:hypothetical protein
MAANIIKNLSDAEKAGKLKEAEENRKGVKDILCLNLT